jgi:hypothetical protein
MNHNDCGHTLSLIDTREICKARAASKSIIA